MKSLSAEVKERIVLFYQNHNAEETARVFGVKKQSVFRYNRLYDGTIESLMDGRKNRSRKDAFTEEEEARNRQTTPRINTASREQSPLLAKSN